jgi:lysophospholipase L1-like esterase
MFECMILGDSIATGIASNRPECIAYATVGVNTRKFVTEHITGDLSAKTVVISLGTNDSRDMKTLSDLFALRQVIKADRVFWVLPAKDSPARASVITTSDRFKDTALTIDNLSRDGIHPTSKGYKELANKTK